MKEYEISNNDKVLGKVSLYLDNIKKNLSNSLIESKSNLSFNVIDKTKYQTYEIEYLINDVDDLFDIVSKYIYDNDKVFETIEEIKKSNNIKTIKKDTNIKIIIPEIYLSKLNIDKNNVDLTSLFYSKIYFLKSVLESINSITEELNNIFNDYNNYINSNEYEFLTDDELKENINLYLKRVDKLIDIVEDNTDYKYGRNYIIPIKIIK